MSCCKNSHFSDEKTIQAVFQDSRLSDLWDGFCQVHSSDSGNRQSLENKYKNDVRGGVMSIVCFWLSRTTKINNKHV